MSYTPLSDERIRQLRWTEPLSVYRFGRAVEAAATAPLLARIAELEAALAEASKDAERLDWLDEQNADLENEAWCVLGHDCTADEDFRKFWVGSDLRGAIDKAMKESTTKT